MKHKRSTEYCNQLFWQMHLCDFYLCDFNLLCNNLEIAEKCFQKLFWDYANLRCQKVADPRIIQIPMELWVGSVWGDQITETHKSFGRFEAWNKENVFSFSLVFYLLVKINIFIAI